MKSEGCSSPLPCLRFPLPTSHNPAWVGFGKGVPFFLRFVGARPTQERVRELFAELDPGLIEHVDFVQLTGIRGRDLEEHHQLADFGGINSVQSNGHVGSPASGQGACRGALLDFYQLTEAVPAEIAKLLDVFEAFWNADIVCAAAD